MKKKFQQLKSPHFVNSLYVVRREFKAEDEQIIGPGAIKMKRPSLWSILEIFNVGIGIKLVSLNGKKYRSLARPLKDSHKKILKCLDIPENVFLLE